MATSNDRAILNSIINPLLPNDEFKALDDAREDIDETDNSENEKSAKEFEKQGVIFAESGKMDEALKMFNNAIDSSPMWASAYNNRAQALRLLKRNEEAMEDLNKAIELSQGRGKAASQAYCQRAMLYHYAGNEELAFTDWESASNLGSQFAKNQLIQKNPYAALCNKMLHDVFKNLKEGSPVK
ncbi:tetratricopeptide repeat protein 36-like [Daphnia pulex]|uniref:tetratricopeptide repeat protein 36-like n=1 Tax=Daphnia pulex TaxID=6669 RepID=UPI001EDE4153|nr:tetratricopeptide repeat protein 36-like [Daphnia pulex]XP_046444734.1 tetratricopeptide repeat protein 36-like [Daphnia pulex]